MAKDFNLENNIYLTLFSIYCQYSPLTLFIKKTQISFLPKNKILFFINKGEFVDILVIGDGYK